jgi:cobalt/nickel transport system permease protein
VHISEGVLSPAVLAAGGGLTAAGVAYALKKMDYDRVPKVAVMSCAFFVASFIHVPVGPVSAHLVLNGLTGVLLGWAAFPAILVALLLQAVLFQFGGLTTLGVNTLTMALPAVLCFMLLTRYIRGTSPTIAALSAFACGALAVLLSGLMVALSLIFSEESFFEAAQIVVLAHIPVMVIEGLVTALSVGFLRKVKPEVLEAPYVNSKTRRG